jgi:hypothetical protein
MNKAPAFVIRAERAFRRVARQLRAENARLGLPLVLGEKGHVRLVRARLKQHAGKLVLNRSIRRKDTSAISSSPDDSFK